MRSISVVLLVLVLGGCPGEAPPCNATTCAEGCCSSAGVCLPGNDKAQCGAGGLFCRQCEEADTCAAGRCDLVRPDAGACPTGFHRCGEACVADTDVATCGRRCDRCPPDNNGQATCSAGVCGQTCRAGFHACGAVCVDSSAPNSCGDRCSPCSFPADSRPACVNLLCAFECNNGFHACGDACASDDAPESCGGRCAPCPAPANGRATCTTARACDFVCEPGFHRCGQQCLSDASPASCGASCTACAGDPNGTATCTAGQCGVACGAGFNRCGGACVANDTVSACGASCVACRAPDGGAPTCVSGACAFTCSSGFNPCNGQCAASTDVSACGASCTRCAQGVPGSNPTCDGAQCGTTCTSGNTRCSGACVGAEVAAACGASCAACPAGAVNQRATCTGTACGVACIDTCAATCVDKQRDAANCGSCGTVCPGACVNGQCATVCARGVIYEGVAETLPHVFVTGADPRFWAVDVSGGPQLELLASAGTGRVTFPNDGNARFLAPVITDAGAALFALGSADFTLDGRADLIAGDLRSLSVVLQGDAGFGAALPLFTNGQNGVTLAADFTGDGRADLVRVPQLGNLNAELWINASADGGAPFTQTRNAAPNLQLAELARAGDLTNDGRADLVTYQAGQLRVFVANGVSSFSQVLPAAPAQPGVVGLAVGEVSRDALIDVVTISSAAVFVARGVGDGGVDLPALVANAGSTLATVEVADLDNDGFADVALGTGRGLEVLWSTGPGTFSAADVYEVEGITPAAPAIALTLVDFTGDGRLDAVLSGTQVRPTLLRNLGPRGFERTVKTAFPNAEFLLVGRIDGDGRDDLLVSRRDTVMSVLPVPTATRVLRSNGVGGFTVGPEDALTRPEALADFDQDGSSDVLRLDCPTPSTCAARVEFSAAFRFGAASLSIPLNEVANEVLLRVADFDADGKTDLLVRTRVGFSVFRNLGSRQFAAPLLTPFLPAVVDVTLSDFDRDGRTDVAVLANANQPRAVYVLLSRAAGLVLAPRPAGFDFDASLTSGFVGADSFADLAGSSGVLLAGDGAGAFTRGVDWKPGPTTPAVSFVVDTDGDGRGEVVSRSFSGTVLANPAVPPRGFSARVERFSDVTGDGLPDWVSLGNNEVLVGRARCR